MLNMSTTLLRVNNMLLPCNEAECRATPCTHVLWDLQVKKERKKHLNNIFQACNANKLDLDVEASFEAGGNCSDWRSGCAASLDDSAHLTASQNLKEVAGRGSQQTTWVCCCFGG